MYHKLKRINMQKNLTYLNDLSRKDHFYHNNNCFLILKFNKTVNYTYLQNQETSI